MGRNNGNGKGERSRSPLPSLAIVGNHSATRHLAPFDDPRFEIWLFNEAPQKTEVYKRWDASFQMHRPEVYTSLDNWVNKDHWAWLQQDHGNKRIFMIEADPRVPNSVTYPLEGVLSMIPFRYLRSSPALALALAIYLGYQEIHLYGSELTSNTEYGYQAINYAFWIGFALGRGIDLQLHCWQSEFTQPIYGYEGETQIEKEHYTERIAMLEENLKHNENELKRTKAKMDEAMLKNDYQLVGKLSTALDIAAPACGAMAGALAEAQRYLERSDPISRQEFERVAAKAQKAGKELQEKMIHAGGKVEYVWNVWMRSGSLAALNQVRAFLKEKTEFAYQSGVQEGIWHENLHYMDEYDKRVTALGGVRALQATEAVHRVQYPE